MIITCPSCQARYPVDAAAFAPSGRKVRCKKCGHVWRQAPLESETSYAAAPAVQSELGLQPQQPAPARAPQAEPAPEPVPPVQDVQEQAAPDPSDSGSRFEAAPAAAPLFEQEESAQKRGRQEPEARDVEIVMAETPDTRDAQTASGSRLRNFVQDAALSRRMRLRDIAIWSALFAVIAATALFFFFYTENPWLNRKTAAVQEAVGQPVNLRGIEFRNVSYERQTENGLPVLAVRGEVVNIADEVRVLPPLRVGLSDGGDPPRELYHWTFTLPEKELAPRQSADFVTRLSSPPANARDLEVRFVMQGEDVGPPPASDGVPDAASDAAASEAPLLAPPATSAPEPSEAEGRAAP